MSTRADTIPRTSNVIAVQKNHCIKLSGEVFTCVLCNMIENLVEMNEKVSDAVWIQEMLCLLCITLL
jgi:hypothetical protein